MRLGLHGLGIGSGATRAVIDAVARAAERCGFATLWAGEHVVMVDQSASRYPYSDDGQIAVPAAADWIDPLIGLSFVAAATSTIGIATGVLLLPEHNPVLVAKQAISIAEETDLINDCAECWSYLAGVLELAGRIDEAVEATRTALELYERKGNVISAARVRALLEPLEHRTPS